MVTKPACGIPAAPMDAAAAVKLNTNIKQNILPVLVDFKYTSGPGS